MKSFIACYIIVACLSVAVGIGGVASGTVFLDSAYVVLRRNPEGSECGRQSVAGMLTMAGGALILCSPLMGAIGAMIGFGGSRAVHGLRASQNRSRMLPPSSPG